MPEDDKKLVAAMQKAAEKELKIKAAKQVYTLHYKQTMLDIFKFCTHVHSQCERESIVCST
jgi:hypothetical protein